MKCDRCYSTTHLPLKEIEMKGYPGTPLEGKVLASRTLCPECCQTLLGYLEDHSFLRHIFNLCNSTQGPRGKDELQTLVEERGELVSVEYEPGHGWSWVFNKDGYCSQHYPTKEAAMDSLLRLLRGD